MYAAVSCIIVLLYLTMYVAKGIFCSKNAKLCSFSLFSDRKIEIPMPNETARIDILKIHSSKIAKSGDIGKTFRAFFLLRKR